MDAGIQKAQLAAVYQQLADVNEELLKEHERRLEAVQAAHASEHTCRDLQAQVQELQFVSRKLQQRLDATKVSIHVLVTYDDA